MRQALEKSLRNQLERAVIKARDIAEVAADQVLKRLNVADRQAAEYLNDDQRKLRNRLRAHARQLGDELVDGQQGTKHLVVEVAYEHWHRMLFARFLEQNSLLMYDEYTALSLDDCNELALDPDTGFGAKDGWELAGIVASKMLPQIFRIESPVFELKFSPEHQRELENIIAKLDLKTFQAQDSLGWVYQFWQSKRKDEVNESEVKIGADELSPVTQLFTESYMVSFLLDNALGAWWAGKQLTEDDFKTATSEQELRDKASIPGVPLEYLRFVKQDEGTTKESWVPASGTLDTWPEHLSELKTLDPCCGSGHFLVSVFLMLVPMRMEMEGLTANESVDKVIAENLHGLELDQRCVEIAVFALALEAWRYEGTGGYRMLPDYHIACSGLSIEEAQKEWAQLAKGNEEVAQAVTWMKHYFKEAPVLGSLIEPCTGKFSEARPWELIQEALPKSKSITLEAEISSKGLVAAARLLSNKYSFVFTNVPYLKAGDQCLELKEFSEDNYPEAKYALETTFMERCHGFLEDYGTCAIVTQQYWLFLKYYSSLREKYITEKGLGLIARLGPGAFDSISGEVVNVCLQITSNNLDECHFGLDVSNSKGVDLKRESLIQNKVKVATQKSQLDNPDFRISFEIDNSFGKPLSEYSDFGKGSVSGDGPHYLRKFWEFPFLPKMATFWLNSPEHGVVWSGRQDCILWGDGGYFDPTVEIGFRHHGQRVYNQKGIAIGKAGKFRFTPYSGELFDDNVAVLKPDKEEDIDALWAYCVSGTLQEDIKTLDKKMSVTAGTFTKVRIDLNYWKSRALEEYPNGIWFPESADFTQWIFSGNPRESKDPLHVAVARLLGYSWPVESNYKIEITKEQRELADDCKSFEQFVDDDGIVCLPAVRAEDTASKRLDDILQAAYGEAWTPLLRDKLLAEAGATSLSVWLRDKFFIQHCNLFQNRPFIWHIWDGLKDGFSALVNYHTLDKSRLERLTYTYLTSGWIKEQEQGVAKGIDGADVRLAAAVSLKERLEKIIEGEAPYDIFVRWKPLSQQPIGWNPDLNDGVRLNIRPFVLVDDVDKKDAGILRHPVTKRDKNKQLAFWKKDRGSDALSAPLYGLGVKYGGKESDRINEHHLTLAEKKNANEQGSQ